MESERKPNSASSALQSLEGKTAVVTGGNKGIGLAIATALADQGCRVMVASRNVLPKTPRRDTSGELISVKCDIRDASSVKQLFASVQERYGSLDILINNAGVAHGLAPVDGISIETWMSVIETNLTGTFLCARAALPLMHPGGTIVNNLSIAAEQTFAGMSAYNASKAGALGFTNALREDLRKRGIRVLALLPGATATDIWQQFWPDAPREKMLSTATVAEAVLHVLALPANATIEEIRLGPAAGVL